MYICCPILVLGYIIKNIILNMHAFKEHTYICFIYQIYRVALADINKIVYRLISIQQIKEANADFKQF